MMHGLLCRKEMGDGKSRDEPQGSSSSDCHVPSGKCSSVIGEADNVTMGKGSWGPDQ